LPAPSPLVGEGRGGGADRTESLRDHARALRGQPTPAERALWQAMRDDALGGIKFRRQQPIGRYIVDFYCSPAKLVVEVDGATHAVSVADAARDAWLLTQGIRVLRFWNNEVMGNLAGVLETILAAASPHPNPPPQGGREVSAPSPLVGEGRGGGSRARKRQP